MKLFILCALMAVVTYCTAQTPCGPISPGPFLGTSPALTMDIYEASAQDLQGSQKDMYRSELKLHGQVGQSGANGILVEVMPDYKFMNPEDTLRFVYDQNERKNYVELYRPLDRDGPTASLDDDTNVFSFTLKCSKQSNTSDFRFFDATIFVHDVNDNDPEFITNTSSSLVINELTPKGLTVLEIKAEDKDISSNLSYSILSAAGNSKDMSGQFEIDPHAGHLSVKKSLDYETMNMGSLVVAVMDNGSPARSATATLTVVVEDGDDQGPVFVYDGCWTHEARCAWPKYTTTTVLKKDQPISVMPVPNKVKAAVPIKAQDLDASSNPIEFSIASTIPPGSENMFRVDKMYSNGEYTATITPLQSMNVNHGFEIFLKAQEQSDQGRFEIAMIFFEETGHECASGSATASGNTGSNDNTSSEGEEEKYSEPIVALIVVVAILGAFVLCLAIAFFCLLQRVKHSSSSDINLTRM